MSKFINNYTKNGRAEPWGKIVENTFHIRSAAGGVGALRQEGIYGSYVEFDCFTDNGFAVSVGDLLLIYENLFIDKSFNESSTLRTVSWGQYYVKQVSESRGILHVVAYNAAYKLDADFSTTLEGMKSSFPMSIKDLVDNVLNTVQFYNALNLQNINSNLALTTLNYFFVNGVTIRNILVWALELFGYSAYCSTTATGQRPGDPYVDYIFKITFQNSPAQDWLSSDNYVICPGDGTYYKPDGVTPAVNVWYKQNGLQIKGVVAPYDGVRIIASNGSIIGEYNSVSTPTNYYYIRNNPIIENINTFYGGIDANSIAQSVYNQLVSNAFTSSFLAAKVSLFPFRSPYGYYGGFFARLYAPDGNYYNVPIVSLDISDDSTVIESYSKEDGDDTYSLYNPSSGGGKKETLWTNQSPDASFAAQTISVDLSGYDLIYIEYKAIASSTFMSGVIDGDTHTILLLAIQNTSNNRNGTRLVTYDTTSVQIGNCTFNGTQTNTYCVPLKIYGVKL